MLDKTNYLNGLGYIGLPTASLLGTKGRITIKDYINAN
jgi:UDP-N-acetyl-D-mannosaminuronate dehydrogenase